MYKYVSNSESFNEITKYIKKYKNGYFMDKGQFISKVNIKLDIKKDDFIMYFAYKYNNIHKDILSSFKKQKKDTNNVDYYRENLLFLYKQVFTITGFINKKTKENNREVLSSDITKDCNPWYISKINNVLADEFSKNLYTNNKIELLIKNVFWINKSVKQINIIKKRYMFDNSKLKKNQKQLDMYSKNKRSDLDKLTSLYGEYIRKQITINELLNNPTYKEILETKEKFNLSEITVEEIYKYISLENMRKILYKFKSLYTSLAIKTILKKNNMCKMYIGIDKKQIKYSGTIAFVLKGYNSPIIIHVDKYTMNTIFGQIETERLNIKETETLKNMTNTVLYKYSYHQLELINKLNKLNIENKKIRRLLHNYNYLKTLNY